MTLPTTKKRPKTAKNDQQRPNTTKNYLKQKSKNNRSEQGYSFYQKQEMNWIWAMTRPTTKKRPKTTKNDQQRPTTTFKKHQK